MDKDLSIDRMVRKLKSLSMQAKSNFNPDNCTKFKIEHSHKNVINLDPDATYDSQIVWSSLLKEGKGLEHHLELANEQRPTPLSTQKKN